MRILRIVGAFGFIADKQWLDQNKGKNVIGGTQVQSYLLSKNIDDAGIEQDIFTRDARGKSMPFDHAHFYSCGINGDKLFLFSALRHASRKEYDIVHVHVGISSIIPLTALVLAKLKRAKLVCTVNLSWKHIEGYGRLRTMTSKLVENIVLRSADQVVSLYPDKQSEKTRFIPDAIDNVFFTNKLAAKREPYLLFVGRAAYQKGLDILLNAYDKSNLNNESIKLVVVVDDGSKLPRLPKGVVVHEQLSRAGVATLMSKALLFILPSRFEERGTVVGEALATGTPALVSDLDNLRRAYSQATETAVSYSFLEVDVLAAAIHKKVNDIGRITSGERKDIRDYATSFHERGVAREYIELYESLLR